MRLKLKIFIDRVNRYYISKLYWRGNFCCPCCMILERSISHFTGVYYWWTGEVRKSLSAFSQLIILEGSCTCDSDAWTTFRTDFISLYCFSLDLFCCGLNPMQQNKMINIVLWIISWLWAYVPATLSSARQLVFCHFLAQHRIKRHVKSASGEKLFYGEILPWSVEQWARMVSHFRYCLPSRILLSRRKREVHAFSALG